MTETKTIGKQKKRRARAGYGQVLYGAFALFCLALVLKNSQIAIEYVTQGLLLCANTVIPSLFPFMVLSELIVSGGILTRLPSALLAPLRRLLGLPDTGVCAVLLGLLCGFPIGARCAVSAYEQGSLTREETERVLLCSNCPSSAFLISAVGVSLWGNRRLGVALYLTVLAVSLLTGILANLIAKKENPDRPISKTIPLVPNTPAGATLFTKAIQSALGGILPVCAYVVFFSALTGTLQLILGRLGLPEEGVALLFCLFELSCGVSRAASISNTIAGAYLCAFAAGWSGLSVHCQMLAICDGKGLSLRPYLRAKLFAGLLCALAFGILITVFPEILIPAEMCVR